MKLVATLTFALYAATATARIFDGSQRTLVDDDSLDVPGKNPLQFCDKQDDYLLTITNVDLSPNPPEAGKNLTISASGLLKEKVEEGAKINVVVKYGVITLIRQSNDLCELVENVDLECPLEKGVLNLSKEVALPSVIPPGTYTVLADVLDKDDKKITCLTAKVSFGK